MQKSFNNGNSCNLSICFYKPIELGGSKYTVTFDPLDGSSIIGTNWSVGSIFGIWKSDEKYITVRFMKTDEKEA